LPPVTKQLKKFVEEDIKEMNAFNQSQDFDFVLKNKKWKEMVRRMTEDILPEEGRDYKKISKLRV
jgi:translation elongation factor EF-Ts